MTRPLSFLFLLLLVFACGIVANLLSLGIWNSAGLDIATLQSDAELVFAERVVMRAGLMVNHAGMFLIPAIVYSIVFYKDKYAVYLKLNNASSLRKYLIWGAIILTSYPLIAWLTTLNTSLPIPEWLQSSQEDSFALLGKTLQMDNMTELVMNIMLVGVLAAVGEELLFRGIIQGQLERLWGNPHKAIWLSAFTFGAIHFQAERLLPLMALGLLLGYSFYHTKSIWVPIILHFLNNSMQVFLLYTQEGDIPDLDNVPEIPFIVVAISGLLMAALFRLASSMNPLHYEP